MTKSFKIGYHVSWNSEARLLSTESGPSEETQGKEIRTVKGTRNSDHQGIHARLAVLASPAFMAALVLLVMNDWWLKPWLHDWFTGKLSDFAGVFVFGSLTLIVSASHPRRMLLGVAVAFAWWKSPYSQAFINLSNSIAPIHVHRTVDYGDLIALVVLPLVALNFRRRVGKRPSPIVVYPIGAVALFSALATSAIPVIDGGEVHMPTANEANTQSPAALYKAIDDFALAHSLPLNQDSVDRFHRRYGSNAMSLEVNYDAASRTLYYGFGPTSNHFPLGGVSVSAAVRAMQKSFLQAITSNFPDVRIEQDEMYSAWGGQRLNAHERADETEFEIEFPEAKTDASGCVRADDSNPDMQRAFQIADDFAKEHGLVAAWGYWHPAGCQALLMRRYEDSRVTGPGWDSYGLRISVNPEFQNLKGLYFTVDRQASDADQGTDLGTQLHDRLSSEQWKSDKVQVGAVNHH